MADVLSTETFSSATLADGVPLKGRPKWPNDGGSIMDTAVSESIDLDNGDFIGILPVPIGARIMAAAIVEGPNTNGVSADDIILVTGTAASPTETTLFDASALTAVTTAPAAGAGIELRKLYTTANGEGVKVTTGFAGREWAVLAIHTNADNAADEYGLTVVYDRDVD